MSATNKLDGDASRDLARKLLYTYFQTQDNFLVRHHIDSFDQFLQSDLKDIIKAANPLMVLKGEYATTTKKLRKDEDPTEYEYTVEVYIGGEDGSAITIGTPTLNLQGGEEVRLMFPNEARIRNLTYQSAVMADILIRVTFGDGPNTASIPEKIRNIVIPKFQLFQIPILLHSRYCILYNKPAAFLQEAGECPNDYGGYFVVDGAEKVLITKQEQAFNTLYVKTQARDPQVHTYASISCLSPTSRMVKRVSFYYTRKKEVLEVEIPMVRKPVSIFILFRALGLSSDGEIMRLLFPDPNSEEAKLLEPLLLPSIAASYPFFDTYTAIEYIKTLTKGFGEAHVIDIIRNQMFIHVPDEGNARIHYLADCVRKILRRVLELDPDTDRDDTRNQRCLTSGFLVQMLFQEVYKGWKKGIVRKIEDAYEYNPTLYRGDSFANIFESANLNTVFMSGFMTEGIKRGFKGKWGLDSAKKKQVCCSRCLV